MDSFFRGIGCHRVALAEEVVRVLVPLASVRVLEVDPTHGKVHERVYPPA